MEAGRRAGAGRPSAHRDVHRPRPFVYHGSILFVSDVMRWFFKPNPPFRCLSSHPSHPRSLSPSFQVRQLSPFGATHALARAGCAVRRRPWPPWPPSTRPLVLCSTREPESRVASSDGPTATANDDDDDDDFGSFELKRHDRPPLFEQRSR